MTSRFTKEDSDRKQVEDEELRDVQAIRQNIYTALGTLRALTSSSLNIGAEWKNIKAKVEQLINVLGPVNDIARAEWVIHQLTPIYDHPQSFANQRELADYLYQPLKETEQLLAVLDRKIDLLSRAKAA